MFGEHYLRDIFSATAPHEIMEGQQSTTTLLIFLNKLSPVSCSLWTPRGGVCILAKPQKKLFFCKFDRETIFLFYFPPLKWILRKNSREGQCHFKMGHFLHNLKLKLINLRVFQNMLCCLHVIKSTFSTLKLQFYNVNHICNISKTPENYFIKLF